MSTKLAIASAIVILCCLSTSLKAETYKIEEFCRYVDYNSVGDLQDNKFVTESYSRPKRSFRFTLNLQMIWSISTKEGSTLILMDSVSQKHRVLTWISAISSTTT